MKRGTMVSIGIGCTVVGLVGLAASPVFSQGRPTLELLAEELCNKAARDGDSYRPRVCEPQCGCSFPLLPAGNYQQNVACQETQPGTFVVSGDGVAFGTCTIYGCADNFGCVSDAQCSPGYTCQDVAGGLFACRASGVSCTTDADCPINGGVNSRSLTGVGPVGSSSAALCALEDANPTPDVLLSSVDANECLEQLLALNGVDCGHRCGNGLLDPGETCDDSNDTPGDGCDASCQIEP